MGGDERGTQSISLLMMMYLGSSHHMGVGEKRGREEEREKKNPKAKEVDMHQLSMKKRKEKRRKGEIITYIFT